MMVFGNWQTPMISMTTGGDGVRLADIKFNHLETEMASVIKTVINQIAVSHEPLRAAVN